jgi:hypothetical protein
VLNQWRRVDCLHAGGVETVALGPSRQHHDPWLPADSRRDPSALTEISARSVKGGGGAYGGIF